MKASPPDKPLAYEVIRSRRATADIIIERDGRVVVRAPEWADDDQVAGIVESRHYWIYQGLAEWRVLNATRVLRQYKSGEGFLYLGRAYRLLLVNNQDEPLILRNGRFTLRRDLGTRERSPRRGPRFGTTTSREGLSACVARWTTSPPRPACRRPVSTCASSAAAGRPARPPASTPSIGSA